MWPVILSHSPDLLTLSFWVPRGAMSRILLSPNLHACPLYILCDFISHFSRWGEIKVIRCEQPQFSMATYKLTCIFTHPASYYKKGSPPHLRPISWPVPWIPSSPDFSLTSLSVIPSHSYLYSQPLPPYWLLPSQVKKSRIPLHPQPSLPLAS